MAAKSVRQLESILFNYCPEVLNGDAFGKPLSHEVGEESLLFPGQLDPHHLQHLHKLVDFQLLVVGVGPEPVADRHALYLQEEVDLL